MDREDFARNVREALAHLYDQPFLEQHPLRALLVGESASPAEDLQRVLVEAIHQLKPSPGSPQYLPRWRRYRHLCLRYLDGADLPVIAEELSISERQVRRDHQDAVDALAAILWARSCRLRWAGAAQSSDGLPAVSGEATLESELRRMVSVPAQGAVPLGEAIESALATVARLAEKRQVAVTVSLPEGLPPIVIDRVVLRQILINMLVYTVDHEGNERVDLSASDQGQRVQLHIATRRKSRGSTRSRQSLADQAVQNPLAASRRLVELHGGIFQQHGDDAGHEEIRLSLPCVPLVTVLVIDDNPDFVRLFQRYLGNSPYRVIQAGVASEALDLARGSRPDVITLDVMMPSQDGWEILQTLKGDRQTSHIPVLVCSVLNEPSLALSLGADAFLAKPVTRQALLAALERCAHLASPEAR
ncbi:MAG: response regulator [Chloroflexi bacterium]|nr:response regulator [Chloroflexota bacterium]